MTFVYDIDLAAFSVAEYKEGVVKHIHLQDSFLNLHWLYREAFGFDGSPIRIIARSKD